MTRGLFCRRSFLAAVPPIFGFPGMTRGLLLLAAAVALLGAGNLPLLADTTSAPPAGSGDFGQYLADHQDDLGPFFSKNAGDFFRLAVPVLLGMTGWIVIFTMLIGWVIDVLASRGYAFFFAPAFADIKRSVIYATGRLFLSFVYTALMALAIVLLLGLPHAEIIILVALLILLLVALAAQIVWILFLFRTSFGLSILFYLAVLLVHAVAGFLIAQPILGSHASTEMTNYIDRVVTLRLQAEAQATRRDLADVTTSRSSAEAKVTDSQNAISQAGSEQGRLTREIEAKKNSDLYTFAQIIKARARGELESARDQLAAFPGKFPGSPLDAQARAQLTAVNEQIVVRDAQHQQEEADAAKEAAASRADLLARAARGEVPLSEMRQTLIGKSRAQVGDLLGPPSDTGPDQWTYSRQMILNPLTSEKTGLTVYFLQGNVQGVDYYRTGGN
jgi:hypothetical protein